jgi:HSP20 family molecular chaperone IbpA
MKRIGKIKSLAQMASIFAAVNGGIISTLKKVEKLDDGLKLQIHLPGIRVDAIKAEIRDNILTVQYFIEMNTEKIRSKIGNIVYNQTLPYFIDVNRVSANFIDSKLDITLPFNELANGYNNEIDIKS